MTPSGGRWTHYLARGASIYLAGMLLGKGILFAVQVILGRSLGAEGYGVYALGYSVITLVFWIASMGMDQGVLRYCSLYRTNMDLDKIRSTIRGALILASVSSVIVALTMIVSSRWIMTHLFPLPGGAFTLAAFAVGLPFVVTIRIAGTFVQAHKDMFGATVLQNLVQPVSNLVFLGVILFLGYRLRGALWAYLLSAVFGAALGIYYLYRLYPDYWFSSRGGFDPRPFFRYSLTLMVIGVNYQLLLRIPTLLLGHLWGAREVGIYSAGASFAFGFAFFPVIFGQPSMPLMVDFYETKRFGELRRLYQTMTRWTLAVVVPLFLFLCLFRNEWLQLFGRDFRGGETVLALLCSGWLISFCVGPVEGLLQMTGRQNIVLVNMIGITAVMIAANYLLIPHWGAVGAAAGSAVALTIWGAVDLIEAWVVYRILPWQRLALRQVLAAGVTWVVGVSLQTKVPFLPAGLIAAGVYAVLFLSFCLDPEDRLLLSAAWRKLRGLFSRPVLAPGQE